MSTDPEKKQAVVLLSGGMDSSTCLALAASQGYDAYCLAFEYGQRHNVELKMAIKQAEAFKAREFRVVPLDLKHIGRSALTADIEVPKTESTNGIPPTYVPARNVIFLSLGLAWAELLGARDIFIGVNQVDFSGYPDCREVFIESFEKMANLATPRGLEGRGVRIQAPLLKMDKAQIIKTGLELGVDFSDTVTCYDPTVEGYACAKCPSCRLRLKGFSDAGEVDPVQYQVE